MKVQADTQNGVYEVREMEDFNSPEIVSEQDFYDSLETMRAGEEYAATLSSEMADKIDSIFGIKRL